MTAQEPEKADRISVEITANDNSTVNVTNTGDITYHRPPPPPPVHSGHPSTSPPAPTNPAPRTEDPSEPPERYDVALSFAGEQRVYVDEVAQGLRARGIRVFYDAFETVRLWGQPLIESLDKIYSEQARYCVVFASADYARKAWTTHELRSAQARAFTERAPYILPARFDDTRIPGIPPTIGYLDLRTITPPQLIELITQKLAAT